MSRRFLLLASTAVAIGLALRALSIAPAGAATLDLAAGAMPQHCFPMVRC